MFDNNCQDLLITPQELKEITQLNTDNVTGTSVVNDKRQRRKFINKRLKQVSGEQSWILIIFCLLIFLLTFASLALITPFSSNTLNGWILLYFKTTFKSVIIASLFFYIFETILLLFYRRKIKALLLDPQLKSLRDLLDEINKYNEVAKDIITQVYAVGELNKAGSKVTVNNNIVTALKSLKKDLIRAIKIERIFRQNPQLNPERLAIDFTPIRALQMNARAQNYSKEVNDLLSIASQVQNEINTLIIQ